MIRWRINVGRWERLHRTVYKLSGTPTTWRQQALTATLHLGHRVTLSHRAAASLALGSRVARIEITMPRDRHHTRPRGIIVHLTQEPIPPEDITKIDGILVTKPARTLLDLAAVEPTHVIERCLDDVLRRKLVSLPFLERWLEDPRRRRHRGTRILRQLVEARANVGVTESPLEMRVLRMLREAGLPIPMLQYVVRHDDRFIARVDLAYPEKLVAIEADGFRYHNGRQPFDRDRARGNELAVLGWQVLRVTSTHLDEDPDAVAQWVRRALGAD